MGDLLAVAYPWVKVGHLVSVISWMAGMFYLPRLFVHHTEKVTIGSETDDLFQMMERKLYTIIMRPAMISTWGFGLALAATPGIVDWVAAWPWIKLLAIIGMSAMHGWLGGRLREMEAGTNTRTGRAYRVANEVPTVLMFVIVIMIIVRPF